VNALPFPLQLKYLLEFVVNLDSKFQFLLLLEFLFASHRSVVTLAVVVASDW